MITQENAPTALNPLYDDNMLDSWARIIKAMANVMLALTGGEEARWRAISRTDLQRAGMWLGKMRMIARTSEYPYPESVKPQSGEKIAAPIHGPEEPIWSDELVAFPNNQSFSYPGVTSWTPIARIKAMRDIVGAGIEFIKAGIEDCHNSADRGHFSYVELTQYAWEGVMCLEHARHSMGMILGAIYDRDNEIGQILQQAHQAPQGGQLDADDSKSEE